MSIMLLGANGVAINSLSTASAMQNILVDVNGNPLAVANGANLPTTPMFTPVGGRNDGAWRAARLDRFGNFRVGFDQQLLYDTCEGSTLNYQIWAPALTTWTVPTQANPAGINVGAGATAAANCAAILLSARQFVKVQQGALRCRFRKRVVTPLSNTVVDFGFGTPSTNTAIVPTGAYWRFNAAGTVTPVLSYNGSEVTGADISASLNNTNYYSYDIIIDDDFAFFVCQNIATGQSISEQTIQMGAAQSRAFNVTHLPVFDRIYSTSSAPSGAPTAVDYTGDVQVIMYDQFRNQPFPHSQAALGLSNLATPGAYTPSSTWANGAAPATSTLTASTAPAIATLGGLYQYTMVAAAESDYPLFAFQIPSPYTFYCTGIHIGQQVVLSLTTGLTAPVLAMWGAGFNSSAASLATTTTVGTSYAANRVAIGNQYLSGSSVATVGVGIGPDLDWHPVTPQVVMPGRYIQIILRLPSVGNLGSACVLRGTVAIDGYYE